MGILNEFQLYIKKQSVKNKNGKCGLSIYEAKKSKKVKYWINYQWQRHYKMLTKRHFRVEANLYQFVFIRNLEVQKQEGRFMGNEPPRIEESVKG